MVRPYAVKGRKRKRREEKYVREEHEEQVTEEETKVEDEDVHDLPGIPIGPSKEKPKTGAVFILERASLEVAKVGKEYQILNSDDHKHFIEKHGKNPAEYRPDIVHQALLMILDSPLNKAKRLRAVYVRTEKGVLFEVKPDCRIPRTFKRFSGLMLQLLQKLSIKAKEEGVGKSRMLMRVIKNPVTQYLPLDSRKIGFSYSSEKLVEMRDYVASVDDGTNFVFVVGAMAHGKIDNDYIDDFLKISEYPLSGAYCITRICNALEQKWKIV